MSPTWVNGRALGVASNGAFTAANTDPIRGGRLWPEAALTWNAMDKAAQADGVQAWEFEPAGSRSSARTIVDQRTFHANQPPPAAFPGTSNHGWAIAVDVKTRRAAAWLMKNAHRFGWSWDEGRRVGEWWHFRYVGASRARLAAIKRSLDPLAGLGPTRKLAAGRLLFHRRGARNTGLVKAKRVKHARHRDKWRQRVERYYRRAPRGRQKRLLGMVLRDRTGAI